MAETGYFRTICTEIPGWIANGCTDRNDGPAEVCRGIKVKGRSGYVGGLLAEGGGPFFQGLDGDGEFFGVEGEDTVEGGAQHGERVHAV